MHKIFKGNKRNDNKANRLNVKNKPLKRFVVLFDGEEDDIFFSKEKAQKYINKVIDHCLNMDIPYEPTMEIVEEYCE